MGMDVYGNAPTSPQGEYFRRNVWGWHPLATLCEKLAPDLTDGCGEWHTNNGHGLDPEQSLALGQFLETALADGRITAYIAIRNAELAAVSVETCNLCSGTGIRTDEIGRQQGMPDKVINTPGHLRLGETGWCNACDGRGSRRPLSTWYSVDEDDVREFAKFLKACGGFEIC